MRDEEFEWDDDKAAANLAKHKVSFEAARLVFSDTFAVGAEDRLNDEGEQRLILIGMAGDRLLHVTYTLRGRLTRIISARPAEPRERRRYHEE